MGVSPQASDGQGSLDLSPPAAAARSEPTQNPPAPLRAATAAAELSSAPASRARPVLPGATAAGETGAPDQPWLRQPQPMGSTLAVAALGASAGGVRRRPPADQNFPHTLLPAA